MTTMAMDAGTAAGRGPRYLNFDAVTTQRVTITARGGRAFELRDDVPAAILLRYQMLPSVEDRSKALLLKLRKEALAARDAKDGAQGDEGETVEAQLERELAEKAALRGAMAGFARELQEDVIDVCGDLFRHTYPALTDGDLFGAWDERRLSHEGGLFTPQEAQQIVELFTSLRGGGFSRLPSATEPQPATTSPTSPMETAAALATTNAR